MAIHPLQKIRCKLQVKTPSEYSYSLVWVELSRLLGEEIPVSIVGLEPCTPGSVVQCLNHLASKQPHLNTSLVVVCCCPFSGSASHHCYRCCWFGLLPRRLQWGHSWWKWGEPDNQLQQTHRSSPQGASHTSSTPWRQGDTTLEERRGTLIYVHVLWEGGGVTAQLPWHVTSH